MLKRNQAMIGKFSWTWSLCRHIKRLWGRALVGILFVVPLVQPVAYGVVVTDDFSDLNDTANPIWTHLDGAVQSTGQTWDASTGQYHLIAPSNGQSPFSGYGFVGSYTGPTFTDVRVTTDFVDFTPTDFQGSVMGITARNDGDNRSIGNAADPNQGFHGYGYNYEANANNGNGEMVLTLIWPGGVKDIGSQKVTLDNSLDYRFVLEVIGARVHGQVFQIDTGTLVAEDFRDVALEPVMIDADFNANTPDVPHVPFTSGYSGIYGYGHVFYRDADLTIDNFRTETAAGGDYNRDGKADAADDVLWRKTVGQMGPIGNPPTSFGDMRANGYVTNRNSPQVIDIFDYDVWRNYFGTLAAGSGSGLANSSSVPEPGSVVLGLGLAGLCASRRRKR
jgi:hypothetical protein